MQKVIFLDRDGVLNVEAGDYITRPDDLHLLPGALEAVAKLTQAGWTVFVFTNQSGVGRGYMTLEDLDAVHASLRAQVESAGGKLTEIYACPHHPDAGCACRKPRAGLLLQAAEEHSLCLSHAYVVGDSPRDIAAAHSAGCRAILVLSGHTREEDLECLPDPGPDDIFPDLAAVAEWLCRPE